VNFATLAAKNLTRNRRRTILTIIGVAVAVLIFLALRTVLWAWNVAAEAAAKDRIVTRHGISMIMPLPIKDAQDIKKVKGVKHVTWMNWFGGKDPNKKDLFFAQFAVDHNTFLEVYDELDVAPEVREAWKTTKNGALVGDVLLEKLGKKVGDKIVLEGTIFPGPWEFQIVGTYTPTRKSFDRMSFMMRYDFLNDDPRFSWNKDKIGFIASRIDDPTRSAQISREIDALRAETGEPLLTMSERTFQLSFMGMISAVLTALDIVSMVILFIMMLILGNTIAMGVRERTHEYGVLRAIGFQPGHVFTFVLGESVLVGLLGGAFGILLAYPLIQMALGGMLEQNFGQFFPYFRIPATTAMIAIGISVALGALAALLPAYRASRLQVTEALRRVA
jgi:putative ABC transport system permease protein